jgi:alpha-L-rhamnosidase
MTDPTGDDRPDHTGDGETGGLNTPRVARRQYLRYTGTVAGGALAAGQTSAATENDQQDAGTATRGPTPTDLRVDYEQSPKNLPPLADPQTADQEDEPYNPRFAWTVQTSGRDDGPRAQSAYRIVVGTDPDAVGRGQGGLWDTGRIESDRSTAIIYDGAPLAQESTYHWAVKVWNEDGSPSQWSEPARFETALPHLSMAWDGEWIGRGDTDPSDGLAPVPEVGRDLGGLEDQPDATAEQQSPLLRTEFEVTKPIESARAHVVMLGYGECYVNGQRQGEAVLDPAPTTFDRRAIYSTHDVTDALEAGTNAVGIWLGRGWFSRSGETIIGYRTGYGQPRALVQLNIHYVDGAVNRVATDTSWRTAPSPIVENDIFDGERYDARRERPAWATPGFDDSDWDDAVRLGKPLPGGQGTASLPRERPSDPDDPILSPQRTQPIRVTDEFDPVAIDALNPGGPYVVDFGQNASGWVELDVQDAEAGQEIIIEHAELLDEDGDLDKSSITGAAAKDVYVAAGRNRETYEPRFTYHGFRYAKVSCYPGELTDEDITMKVVRTDLTSPSSFECSDSALEDVHHAALWSLRSNQHGIPTDCPQRSERQGWTGDAHMTCRTSLYTFDAVRFWEKWLGDHADNIGAAGSQSDTIPHVNGAPDNADPNWAKTQATVPWYLYLHTGDETILEKHFENMAAYANYRHELTGGTGIVPQSEVHYADWLAYEGSDKSFVGTFGHYQTTVAAARAAAVLGRPEAATFRQRAVDIVDRVNDIYFDSAGDVYAQETSDGGGDTYTEATQTEQALPLFAGWVPDGHEAGVAETLATLVQDRDNGHIQTGFVGTRPLLFALTEHGYADIVYRMIARPDRPSWRFMTDRGATTLWEWFGVGRGAGLEPERGGRIDRASTLTSRNHRQLPLVSEWFYRGLVGIDAADPGFKRIEIDPTLVSALDHAGAEVTTPHGPVHSRWERSDDGLELEASLPWNTTASVHVPTLGFDAVAVRERDPLWQDGEAARSLPEGIVSVSRQDSAVVIEAEAGDYSFVLDPIE